MTEVLSEIRSDGTADNYLEDIKNLIGYISDELNRLTTFKIDEFYSEIWAVSLNENFKKSKITFTDGKWIDNAPSIYKNDVYFASNRNSKEFDIWRVKIGGGSGITKITNSPYSQDMEPSVDETGSLISYSSLPIGAKNYQIWTINSDGTLPSQLKKGKPNSICSNRIAFVRKNKKGKSQIWLINTDGAEETLLSTNINVNESEPSFSPDCEWIVYTSDESGNKDIWMMRADGSQRTQLTTNPSTDIHPTWGNDGYVYFVSNRGLLWGIWRLQPRMSN
jgi:Tol biopolymer transport system component